MNQMSSDLVQRELIPRNLLQHLKSHYGVPSTLCALPKLHKMTYFNIKLVIPMRSFVSCVNFVTYNLSKFLEKSLRPVLGQSD